VEQCGQILIIMWILLYISLRFGDVDL